MNDEEEGIYKEELLYWDLESLDPLWVEWVDAKTRVEPLFPIRYQSGGPGVVGYPEVHHQAFIGPEPPEPPSFPWIRFDFVRKKVKVQTHLFTIWVPTFNDHGMRRWNGRHYPVDIETMVEVEDIPPSTHYPDIKVLHLYEVWEEWNGKWIGEELRIPVDYRPVGDGSLWMGLTPPNPYDNWAQYGGIQTAEGILGEMPQISRLLMIHDQFEVEEDEIKGKRAIRMKEEMEDKHG